MNWSQKNDPFFSILLEPDYIQILIGKGFSWPVGSMDADTDLEFGFGSRQAKIVTKKKKQRNFIFKELYDWPAFLLEPEVLCKGLRDMVYDFIGSRLRNVLDLNPAKCLNPYPDSVNPDPKTLLCLTISLRY
jgi:hypothetical protein